MLGRDRLPAESNQGSAVTRRRSLVPEVTPFQISSVCFGIIRVVFGKQFSILTAQIPDQRFCDLLRDGILERKHVGKFLIKCSRPEHCAVPDS